MTFNLQSFREGFLQGYLCLYLRRILIHHIQCKGPPSAHTRKRKYSAIENLWKILYLIVKIVEVLLSPPMDRQYVRVSAVHTYVHLMIGGDRCN